MMQGLEGKADTNNDKQITANELFAYLSSNVSKQAETIGREQQPQLLEELIDYCSMVTKHFKSLPIIILSTAISLIFISILSFSQNLEAKRKPSN